MTPNVYRHPLREIRLLLDELAAKPSQLEERVKKVTKFNGALKNMTRVGKETGNVALLRTVVYFASRRIAEEGGDWEVVRATLMRDFGLEAETAVCTVCGRVWRGPEEGWKLLDADDGRAWGGEMFACCGATCMKALALDWLPGYASFVDGDSVRRFAKEQALPVKPLLGGPARSKPSARARA